MEMGVEIESSYLYLHLYLRTSLPHASIPGPKTFQNNVEMSKCWNLEITGGSLGRSQLKLPSTGYVFIVVLLHYPYTFGVK